jgi:hypothetical protein
MKRLIVLNLIFCALVGRRVRAQFTTGYPAYGTGSAYQTVDEKVDISVGQGTTDPCTQSATAASSEVTAGNTAPILDWTAASVATACTTTDPNATTGVAAQTIILPAKTVVINLPWTIGAGKRVRGQLPGTSTVPVSVLQAGPSFPVGFGTHLATGSGTLVSLSNSPATASFFLSGVAKSETWIQHQFLRVYNASNGTVYYGTITTNSGSGMSVDLDPPPTAAAAAACPSPPSTPCSYMVETPLIILGSPQSAPTNAQTYNSELSGVLLDCNHVAGCVGWVDVPGQEGTTVNFVSTINFTAGCGRIVAPNSGPYTILGCSGNTSDPVVDTLPLLVCTTPSASREIRDFTFKMVTGQTHQPNVGVDIEATCAESNGTTTGGGQTMIEAGHIERVTTSYLIGAGGSGTSSGAVNNVIIRDVNQANGSQPTTQVLISNNATNTGNIMLEGFTCGGLTTGTLLSDLITGNTVSCNGGGGSGGAENMGFYFLGEVASSGLRTVLSSFSSVTNRMTNFYAESVLSGPALNPLLLISSTAPLIYSGFGASASISSSNGTAAFTVNVGTGGTATSGEVQLPAASTGWNCTCADLTTQTTTVFLCKQTATSSPMTTAGIANFNTAGGAAAWVANAH